MKAVIKSVFAAAALTIATAASAQYTIVLNDNSRIYVDDSTLSFEGEGETGTLLRADGQTYPLCDIRSIESGVNPQPIVLAYHPYYSSKMPLADKVTHISYGFAEVYVKNGVYQGFKLQGQERAFKNVVNLKQTNPSVKILLSFSHTVVNSDNSQDGGFSAIATSDEYRQAFANDCLEFVEKWGIDGIDLDWEFPGLSWSGAACDPVNDVDNYTLLMQQLRATLGPAYELTFAGYCMDKRTTSAGSRYIDLAAVEPFVDFVNVMTYDLDEAPHFHNAIKSSVSYYDIERTIASYTKAGVPMAKVVLGIPCYARHSFGSSPSAIKYPDIKALASKEGYEIDNWDEKAQVPYITYNGVMYGSYDNPRSIAAKWQYATEKGLGGMFYWCTYEDDSDHTLARAIWQAVCGEE